MSSTQKLGDPDIKVGRLCIRVHGRQFPESQDFWDSNWLSVTAEYKGLGSRVTAHGAFIHLGELSGFLGQLETLNDVLKGEAVLGCMEPNLRVEMHAKSLGHIEVKTTLTPDHMTESHGFTEQIDQTFLPGILEGLRLVMSRYPVREPDKVKK
jgi:hypothetical protein